MEGLRTMLRWLGDHIPFMPSGPHDLQQTTTDRHAETLKRADRAIQHADDQWARVVREGWGLWDDEGEVRQ